MGRFNSIIIFLFLVFVLLLSGCTTQTSSGTKNYDHRLIGEWKNHQTKEVLTFFSNGIYSLSEAEMEDWSTDEGGQLWMYGRLYSYSLSENNTILSITGEGYTRIYQKI